MNRETNHTKGTTQIICQQLLDNWEDGSLKSVNLEARTKYIYDLLHDLKDDIWEDLANTVVEQIGSPTIKNIRKTMENLNAKA